LLAGLAAIVAAFAPGAVSAPAPACPSGGTPAPGSTINALVVDGVCILDNVTIHNGVTVNGGGHLQLTNSTVDGGIAVNAGGELDLDAIVFDGSPTGATSLVNGGITITNASDYDLENATINGGLTISGSSPFSGPTACGLTVNGDVTYTNVSAGGNSFFGDPEDSPFSSGAACLGNTVNGSLFMTNFSSFIDFEGNSFTGSASITGSRLELNGDTIGGTLTCGAGNTFLAPAGPDPKTDTIQGEIVSALHPC
jgi:hypothetical protein